MQAGSGERASRHASRGFTYLGLLLVIALTGAALSALGPLWSTAAQRERERELRFRGEQIRDAIGRYRRAREPRAWPETLEQLLEDRRESEPRHHLRRLWTDPFTGRVDWVLLPAPAQADGVVVGFMGVRSSSDVARLVGGAAAPNGKRPKVSDWQFVHADGAPAPPAVAASAAQ